MGNPVSYWDWEILFILFNSTEKRNELKEIIRTNQSKTEFVDFMTINYQQWSKDWSQYFDNYWIDNSNQQFSTTFERYTSLLILREFKWISHAYWVELNTEDQDIWDLDWIVALRDFNLINFVYCECKSWKIKAVDVNKTLRRSSYIWALSTIIICDNFKIKWVESMLRDNKIKHPIMDNVIYFNKIESWSSYIVRFRNTFFINSSKDITDQVRTILKVKYWENYMKSMMIWCSSEDYKKIWIQVDDIIIN